MCYMRRKVEGGVGALRESDDTNFLKPDGQSRNLNVYGYNWPNFNLTGLLIGSFFTSFGSRAVTEDHNSK